MSILDKTLQGYHDQKLCVQEFLVWMSNVDSESVLVLPKWIPRVVIDMGVKTFLLHYYLENSTYFDFPSVVFEAKSLEELYLERCKLGGLKAPDKVLFSHLQTLYLTRVYITDETFQKIISSCPLIEYMFLFNCEGLRTIKMNKLHNLQEFDFRDHNDRSIEEEDDRSIEIDAPTIETIIILGCPNWFHHHMYFPHLSYLYMEKVRLCSKSSFDFLSCNLPYLEDLALVSCYGFEEFQLLNRSIKRLTVWGMEKSIKATIDAPNLVLFEYEGKIPPSISFTAITSNEWKSKITLWYDVDIDTDRSSSSWLLKLNKLLNVVSRSEISLSLFQHTRTNHEQLFEDVVPDQLVVVEHLNFSLGGYPCSSLPPFLNCLFRICRPRFIGPYLHDNPLIETVMPQKNLTEYLCKILIMERETMHFFWQQDLEEVSMEASDHNNGKEWHPVLIQETNNQDRPQNVRFRLKWKELIEMSVISPNS
ncbi:hypothetical protein DH2020_004967 [Rehmannia glutinosa]|uniref:F-box/LRR-repeat protein 15/At3g58940/PEG3-like LRR domain-containing protein n=1 Tax=Rehmannia glutinosa TaxID=99300 RepID=A0ABR0XQX0_REHGL